MPRLPAGFFHPTSRDDADWIFTALGDYYGRLKDKFDVQWTVNYSPPREPAGDG